MTPRSVGRHRNPCGLPIELWLVIFELCGEAPPWRFKRLRNVSHTCKLFRHLADVMIKDQLLLWESSTEMNLREMLSPRGVRWLLGRDHVRLGSIGRKTIFRYWKISLGRDRPITLRAFSGQAGVRGLTLVAKGSTKYLLNILNSLTHLEKLQIIGCGYDRMIHHRVCHWPSLKELTLNNVTIHHGDSLPSFEDAQTSLRALMIFDYHIGFETASNNYNISDKLIGTLPLSTLKELRLVMPFCSISELLLKAVKTTLIEHSLLTLELDALTIDRRGLQGLLQVQRMIGSLLLSFFKPSTSILDSDERHFYPGLQSLRVFGLGDIIPSLSTGELQQLTCAFLHTNAPVNHSILDRMISAAHTAPMALRLLDIDVASSTDNQDYVRRISVAFPRLVILRLRFPGPYVYSEPHVPKRVLLVDVPEALYTLKSLETLEFDDWDSISDVDYCLSFAEGGYISLQGQLDLMLEWGRRCSRLQKVGLAKVEWVRVAAEEWKAYDIRKWDVALRIDTGIFSYCPHID